MMNRRTKPLFFFLLLFLSFLIFPTSVAVGETTEVNQSGQTTITHNWLYTSINTDEVNSRIKFYTGGESLFSVSKIQTEDKGNGTFRFAYDVNFGFTIVAYTKEDLYSIFPEIDTNAQQDYYWLVYSIYKAFQYQGTYHYAETYSTINFGDKINRVYFDTEIPITVGLNPDITFYDFTGATVGGIPIANSNYDFLVKNVKMEDYEAKELGQYEDVIKDQVSEDVSDVTVDAKRLGKDTAESEAYEEIKHMNLGTSLLGEWSTSTVNPGQPGRYDASPGTHHNREFGDFTFYQPIEIQPGVEVTQRQVQVRGARLDLGFLWGFSNVRTLQDYTFVTPTSIDYLPHSYPNETVPNIYQKAHVYNYGIMMNFTTNIQFICDISIDSFEEYVSGINWPLFEQGDFIWEFQRGGTTDLTLYSTETPTDWFKRFLGGFGIIAIIILIIIVIITILFLKYGLKAINSYYSKKQTPYKK